MKVWGLYSTLVDPYHADELIEVFADQEAAETVRANLIGKTRYREVNWPWEDDEDFPDLYVRPIELR